MSRCGYCRRRGHNRRTCQEYTEALKRAADHVIANGGDSSSYSVRRYKEHIRKSSAKKVKNMTCGYCQERGHTRRTCDAMERDKDFYLIHHNSLAKICEDYVNKSPVGIGSLFLLENERWDGKYYKRIKSHLILVDFEIQDDLLSHNPQIRATLQDPVSGEYARTELRHFVRHPTQKYGSSFYGISLVFAEPQSTPRKFENWRISKKQLKGHPLFQRIGDKNKDSRNYEFRLIENLKKRKKHEPGSYAYEQACKELQNWSPSHIRERLFKDFQNEG